MDQHEIFARQALISRLIDASAEGYEVKATFAGLEKTFLVRDPVSSGGVLTFTAPSGTTIRVLESTIIAIEEQELLDL